MRRHCVPLRFPLQLTLLLALSACGGGGGEEGASTNSAGPSGPLTQASPATAASATITTLPSPAIAPITTAPVTPAPTGTADTAGTIGSAQTALSTIVATGVSTSYASGSEEAQAFELLNAERSKCGFGTLSSNDRLDAAAKGHADWAMVNNYIGHYQVEGTPGFTGVSALDRAVAAGYSPSSILDEYSTGLGTASRSGKGVASVRGLLSAPYHTAGLMGGYREIGISLRSSDDVGTTTRYGARYVAQFDLARSGDAVAQEPAGDQVLTYPCQGTTGTAYEVRNEIPSPVPDRDLGRSPIGQPVVVMVRADQGLAVDSASMKTVIGGVAVPLRTPMNSMNDFNKLLRPNEILVIPDSPLSPSTEYTVSLSGRNNGVFFSRNFTFRTGA